ncbi:type II secretion system F family protein [Gilvimarinus sp. DA14]|uniref:type II secretion system F family protein n=1 Tax=Gilvimarinus sp. DA14 TaxID=2956798 RepID=UPI0020B747D5|nr:type II secretion system F family protein [Gilvimarinus sp. DA14]UTF59446.1 type II secretion system F family protein [Gilvimarinus sp. DA14]
MNNLVAFGAGAAMAGAVMAVIYFVAALSYMLTDEERTYMDEPPAFMKPVWPLIRLVTYILGSNLPSSYLTKVDNQLQKNGVSFMVTAEEYISARVVFALLLPFLGWCALASSGKVDPLMLVLLAAGGYFLPVTWVKDARRKRDAELIRSLPVYLEYLTMCVDAGLNFSGALKQAVEKGPRGAMRNEFRIVLRDISSGQTRADALNRLADRVDLKDISIFVRAVVQAEKMGSSMKDTLLVQAKTRLNERFQRAEKMAMEAPVKLVIPLVIFIFPLTFIILLFPIVVKYIEQGTF